ncbi:MAG: YraN family protein [Bacteroidota bacterium]
MAEHNDIGKLGEDLAVKYLMKEGYVILNRNWHFGKEELDIVARKDDFIVFVEVKTRASNAFGYPEEFVTRKKQKHLIKVANAYIEKKKSDNESEI